MTQVGQFLAIPTATVSWEGTEEYNSGFTRLHEFEIELAWQGDDQIKVAEHVLTYDQAHALYMDLVSATISTVVQKREKVHPFSVRTRVEVAFFDNGSAPGDEAVEEIITWLRFVLGMRVFEGKLDEWEYDGDGDVIPVEPWEPTGPKVVPQS